MTDQSQSEKPALTVIIQSWWTPALAVIMLVVGLLAGYFGRPLLNKSQPQVTQVAAVTTPVATVSVTQPTVPTSTIDPTLQAVTTREQLMDYLVSHTTHMLGDASAKVTIIEFSDYQ